MKKLRMADISPPKPGFRYSQIKTQAGISGIDEYNSKEPPPDTQSHDPREDVAEEIPINDGDDTVNWFYAKRPGNCKSCGQQFLLNSLIGYMDGELVGKDCCGGLSMFGQLKSLIPHGKTAKDYCRNCFMVHATLQTECE